jgi:hypothetical protein
MAVMAGAQGAMPLEPGAVWHRHIDVRTFLIVLALAVTGCSSGGHVSAGDAGAPARPAASVHTAPPAAAGRSSAQVSARVVLPSHTMTAGSSMPGRVVVENNTGRPIFVSGCLSLFQVALVNSTYRPAVGWFLCRQKFTIPVGQSAYPVTVAASYSTCSQGRPQGAARVCLSDGHPPSLPPGDYHAVLFQAHHLVPAPPAVTVRVTAPEPAP